MKIAHLGCLVWQTSSKISFLSNSQNFFTLFFAVSQVGKEYPVLVLLAISFTRN